MGLGLGLGMGLSRCTHLSARAQPASGSVTLVSERKRCRLAWLGLGSR